VLLGALQRIFGPPPRGSEATPDSSRDLTRTRFVRDAFIAKTDIICKNASLAAELSELNAEKSIDFSRTAHEPRVCRYRSGCIVGIPQDRRRTEVLGRWNGRLEEPPRFALPAECMGGQRCYETILYFHYRVSAGG
jgi:hypothetical protein